MAGAIRLGPDPAAHLSLLLDILYTPWELPLDPRVPEQVCGVLREHYGEEWAARFRRAAEISNYHVNKVHSPDIDRLQAELAAAKKSLLKRLFGAGGR